MWANVTMDVMELRLTPSLEAKLGQLSAETGRPTDELVEEALTGYLEELAAVRGMLDARYDELKERSGAGYRGSRGAESTAKEESNAPHRTAGVTARYVLHPEALRDLEEIWEYIAQDSFDAADRVIGHAGRFAPRGPPPSRADVAAVAALASAELPRRLRAGRAAAPGGGRASWTAQPAGHCCDASREGVARPRPLPWRRRALCPGRRGRRGDLRCRRRGG